MLRGPKPNLGLHLSLRLSHSVCTLSFSVSLRLQARRQAPPSDHRSTSVNHLPIVSFSPSLPHFLSLPLCFTSLGRLRPLHARLPPYSTAINNSSPFLLVSLSDLIFVYAFSLKFVPLSFFLSISPYLAHLSVLFRSPSLLPPKPCHTVSHEVERSQRRAATCPPFKPL
ncbi:hypothetical protein I3760_14G119000 [Carya illinoinensis]|nr:hypothetical protein I3760_14G119000 [Carya illinoinensis]